MARLFNIPGINTALESEVIGKLNKEIEYTIYAELKDMSQLEKAPVMELHEQWRLPIDTEAPVKLRMRLINNRRFTVTAKKSIQGAEGYYEITTDVPEDMFSILKLAAVDGYKKTRYVFPVTGSDRKWEVDVFMDKSGKPHNWVKIDLEVQSMDEAIPPFELTVGKFIIEGKTTPEEDKFINRLWNDEWLKIETGVVKTSI
jgi:hypothetical protein